MDTKDYKHLGPASLRRPRASAAEDEEKEKLTKAFQDINIALEDIRDQLKKMLKELNEFNTQQRRKR